MIKLLMTWRDNPKLGAEQCDRHYLGTHTRMANAVLADVPGFLRYTQNRVTRHFVHSHNAREAVDREPEFHRTIELYFTDQEALNRVFTRPEMQLMFNDHPNFMQTDVDPSQSVYIMDEIVALERGRDGTLMIPAPEELLRFDWSPLKDKK
jgi:hypothetical protein